jgi:hypothetical protein
MVKPVGGRGHKAPYETMQMRVPVPIKPQVENLISRYRETILSGNEAIENQSLSEEQFLEYIVCLKVVDKFVQEIGQSESLYDSTKRNNRNLAKFRDWLIQRTKN